MRPLSRFLPKPKDPELAKNWAVFTTLFLIFCSYVITVGIAFGLPILLTKVLSDSTPESTKTSLSVVLGLVVSGFLAWISWDMVDAMVGSAIKADVQVKEQQIKAELEAYKKENDEKEHVKRQDLEFRSIIAKAISGIDGYSDESLRRAFRKRVARDVIIKELAYNDDLLQRIALSATKSALKMEGVSGKEARQDTTATLFCQDIYIYLKAWLMHSISNGREMDAGIIKQRCLGKQAEYIKALSDIKERLIRTPKVADSLQSEYSPDAIQLLDEYLGKLITQLRSNYHKVNVH